MRWAVRRWRSIGIHRSIEAWQTIAAEDPDARIGGFVELLEALRTGMELHFPDARDVLHPGSGSRRQTGADSSASPPGQPSRPAPSLS